MLKHIYIEDEDREKYIDMCNENPEIAKEFHEFLGKYAMSSFVLSASVDMSDSDDKTCIVIFKDRGDKGIRIINTKYI